MTATCWLSFGPDLEPLEIQTRRQAEPPGPRPDGLLIAGDADAVAQQLADACRSSNGWCRLETVDGDGEHRPVHVHAQLVRFVSPVAPSHP